MVYDPRRSYGVYDEENEAAREFESSGRDVIEIEVILPRIGNCGAC